MQPDRSLALAGGGLAAMTAALGIGRFVYTPILPSMLGALGWSKSEAGLVASANFLGYLVGALLAGRPQVAARPRSWLLAALAISAASTAAMALPSDIASFAGLRFIGGVASAFVIVCASTLVLERLSFSGRGSLSADPLRRGRLRHRGFGHRRFGDAGSGRRVAQPVDRLRRDRGARRRSSLRR